MSLVETIRLWQEGVCAADRREWGAALEAFTAVQNPPAKICFNIGCVQLVLGELEEAEQVRYSPGAAHRPPRGLPDTQTGWGGKELKGSRSKGWIRGFLKL